MDKAKYTVWASSLCLSFQDQGDPVDIDKASFQPPLFMGKVLKECSLSELYHKEERMKKGRVSGE